MRTIGYLGSSNKSVYTVQKDGVDFDLAAAGVIRLDVVEDGKTLSTASGEITITGAQIEIEWGAFDLPSNNYMPTIYAYKAGDDKGEVIFGPAENSINLLLYPDERPST